MRVRAAAAIAERFGLDPVQVLAETDPVKAGVRIAGARWLAAEQRKQQQPATE